MAESDWCIVPQPKSVTARAGRFALNDSTRLVLPVTASDEDIFAARLLQAEISAATGLRPPLLKMARGEPTPGSILLRSDWDVPELVDTVEVAGKASQAYGLDIAEEGITAGGAGTVALFYAVQTLRQLVRTEGATLPCLRLVDWPSLPYRGLMLDISRGKVPALETLCELVDRLALCKANVLQLYTEHTFVFTSHPRIGQDCGSLSSDDILALDAYARAQHIELMPNLQSFGHCAHILGLEEYAHLAESDAARWSLCPIDEGTYTLLGDLYADLLPSFHSTTLNAGCDETWDLGTGRSAEAVEAQGTGRVYLGHILRLRELAAQHDCRIQIWGDILLHHPELVPELPDDVTLLDWHYEAAEDYPSVGVFAESGRDFWVCPGTSTWNTLFPRIENSNPNIRVLARVGVAQGAKGMLNTDWGDHGHYQPIGQCWYAYCYGAEQSWSGGETDDAAYDARFGRIWQGKEGEAVVANMRTLARLNTLPGMPRSNASNSIFSLLDEPLVGPITNELPAATLDEIESTCERAIADLRAARAECRDPRSVDEIVYSARMMAYAARKTHVCQRIRADIGALAKGEGNAAEVLAGAIADLRALDAELAPLIIAFRKGWLARARHSEISITLGHLSGVRERLACARAWLRARLDQVSAGERPDYDLAGYAQEAASYEILGQRFHRQMREAGVAL